MYRRYRRGEVESKRRQGRVLACSREQLQMRAVCFQYIEGKIRQVQLNRARDNEQALN